MIQVLGLILMAPLRLLRLLLRGLFSRKTLAVIFGIIALIIIIIYIPFYNNPNFYRDWIIGQINSYIPFEIKYEETYPVFYPYPGLVIRGAELYKQRKTGDTAPLEHPLMNVEKISIHLDWRTFFFRDIRIHSVDIYDGQLYLTRNRDGSFNVTGSEEEKNNGDEQSTGKKSDKGVDKPDGGALDTLALIETIPLRLNRIHILGFSVYYKDVKGKREHRLYISDFTTVLDHENLILSSNLTGKIDRKRISLRTRAGIPAFPISMENLKYDVNIQLEDFSLGIFKDFFWDLMPRANFNPTHLHNASIHISKSPGEPLVIDSGGRMNGIAERNGIPFANVDYTVRVTLDSPNKWMSIDHFTARWADKANLYGDGKYDWSSGVMQAHFRLFGNYLDFTPAWKGWMAIQLKFPPKKDPDGKIIPYKPGYYHTYMDLKNVQFNRNFFNTMRGNMTYHYKVLTIQKMESTLYGGRVINRNLVIRGRAPTYIRSDVEIQGVDMESYIAGFTPHKYITGKLYTRFKFKTDITDPKLVMKKLRVRGKMRVVNGELLSYANILRPVATIGKYLNFMGPSGKSTEFEYLESEYIIRNNKLYLRGLHLEGVGMGADGYGHIGFDQTIDLHITISFGGVLFGKALKVPIIYDGVVNEDLPYVDPIWLSAMYVGATVPSPLGPVGGALMGAVVAEYIRDAWNEVKSWFADDDDPSDPFDDDKWKVDGAIPPIKEDVIVDDEENGNASGEDMENED